MRTLWRKLKWWYWWKFQATEKEKVDWQMLVYGSGIYKQTLKGKKFVDIRKFYIEPQ